jgi:hypothetical protein
LTARWWRHPITSVFNLTGEQAIPVDLRPPLTPVINV